VEREHILRPLDSHQIACAQSVAWASIQYIQERRPLQHVSVHQDFLVICVRRAASATTNAPSVALLVWHVLPTRCQEQAAFSSKVSQCLIVCFSVLKSVWSLLRDQGIFPQVFCLWKSFSRNMWTGRVKNYIDDVLPTMSNKKIHHSKKKNYLYIPAWKNKRLESPDIHLLCYAQNVN